jgi:hypothetical protein
MKHLPVGAAIVLLTLLSFFQFPGHTFLQSDTQIYIPILENLWNRGVLTNEILVQRPHVSFTIYDEVAIVLRRLTGLGFQEVLQAEEIATRGLGIWGIYLLAMAAGLATAPALLVTAIISLGATISGPAVLIFEYEPVPRGFAMPLLYLAIGLTAHSRYVWAGAAASLAFLFHPPSVLPFWLIYFLLVLWPSDPEIMRRRLLGLIPLVGGALVLLIASRAQPGSGETQVFFRRLDKLQLDLQLMRTNYVFVSSWWKTWMWHYLVLLAAGVFAFFRHMRLELRGDRMAVRLFVLGLPVVGLLTVLASYVLMERQHWALIPQFQPARALLFVTMMGMFCAAVAGCRAATGNRFIESILWFALALLPPTNNRVLGFTSWNPVVVVAVLAVLTALACRGYANRKRWAAPLMAAAALLCFFVIPGYGGFRNYPHLRTPEIKRLAAWAREATPPSSVFLFPDAGEDLAPGIFRALSLRAVYVDWKGGGQVNYLKDLGEQWWSRWQIAMKGPVDAVRYRALGINYIVLKPGHRLDSLSPLFENDKYSVYAIPPA